ncbi:MAG: SDR family oxidoreductase [Hydrococcus sp. Prado102]|jgi:nucleoside-diphosphate-sugar epimerase|nr:SDR family oxidoreductase [Hydrococcus sp. Prado102]
MTTLLTGATGLSGTLFLKRLAEHCPGTNIDCLVRSTSDRTVLDRLDLKLTYYVGDSSIPETWDEILTQKKFDTIIHLVQLRQVPTILKCLKKAEQTPRLIIIGTTGIYSKYNQYSAGYQEAEKELAQYPGSFCLLRPTMIYGSPKDQNLHKLIKFCDRYGFFPVFGSGNNLLQPIHADDIAQALLSIWNRPHLRGAYDISGGTIVTLYELLQLVEKLINKPVRKISFPLNIGIWLATILEGILGEKSLVRREQILRLQEDKAYPHALAQKDLDFFPRTLEVGLQEEVALMRTQGII